MFRKCKFCIKYVNMSLTSTVDLKVIPLCVNKKGEVTVKVHLSLRLIIQKWRKWAGCFTASRRTRSHVSDLVYCCSSPNFFFSFFFDAKVHSDLFWSEVLLCQCVFNQNTVYWWCFYVLFFFPQRVWNIWRKSSSTSVSTLRTPAWRGWAPSRICRRLCTWWRWCHVEMWLIKASSLCTNSGELLLFDLFLYLHLCKVK